jgi:protoporphyrinogen oxidase
MVRIGASYLRARLQPIRDESSLEDFMINRFGRELYATFFEDYTEKVWGVPCRADQGRLGCAADQGPVGLEGARARARSAAARRRPGGDIYQRETETSLIERFLYPKRGPGQLWEEVTRGSSSAAARSSSHARVTAFHVAASGSSPPRSATPTATCARRGRLLLLDDARYAS